MLKFVPYVLKTLWRHRTRTALTVSGSAVALFVFFVIGSVQEGLDALTTQNARTLVVFQANKFCPATSHLPQDYDARIAEIPGVREAVPIQVFTNNCRASLDVVVFYGLPPASVRRVRDFRLVEGSWQEFEEHQDAGLVGNRLAARREIALGDKFTIGDVTVTVAGIFDSDDPTEQSYVYTHLEFLQRTRGLDLVGTVTQLEVVLDESADAETVCDAIDDRFRAGPVETDTRTKGAFQTSSLADLVDLIGLSHYLGYACLGLMLVLVATTSLMAVQDRIREHAVLQTLGFTSARVFRLVLTESVLTSVLGGAIGIAAAVGLLSLNGLSIGAEAVSVAFTPTLDLAAESSLLALGIGAVAGMAPAWQAARAEIVQALRS